MDIPVEVDTGKRFVEKSNKFSRRYLIIVIDLIEGPLDEVDGDMAVEDACEVRVFQGRASP